MLIIIPARKGSKGLPLKNKKLLNGRPLIEYTLDVAFSLDEKFSVIVSTDDPDIHSISKSYPCFDIGLRPSYLATDNSRAIDTYRYVIEEAEKHSLNTNDICILQPTSPFRTSSDLKKAIELYRNKDADSVISYCKENHPVTWHKYLNEDFSFRNIFEDNIDNRQKNKISYYPNGAIFIFKKKLLLSGIYYTKNSYAYIMDKLSSIDIDYKEDFEYAEYLINKNENDV